MEESLYRWFYVFLMVVTSTGVDSSPTMKLKSSNRQWLQLNRGQGMLLKTLLRWVGHVSRVENRRLPEVALYGEPSSAWLPWHRGCKQPLHSLNKEVSLVWRRTSVPARRWPPLAYSRCWSRSLETHHPWLSPPSKATAGSSLKSKGEGGRSMKTPVSSPDCRLSPAAPAVGSICPVVDLPATSGACSRPGILPFVTLRSRSYAMMWYDNNIVLIFFYRATLQFSIFCA